MCTFEVYNLKEVIRGQLQSAAKYFMKKAKSVKSTISKADKKQQLLIPLAYIFIREGIVIIQEGANIYNLTRNDVTKEKTF